MGTSPQSLIGGFHPFHFCQLPAFACILILFTVTIYIDMWAGIDACTSAPVLTCSPFLAVHMDYNTMAQDFIYQRSEAEDIDLGLSLSTSLQQESFHHPSGRLLNPSEYGELMAWPQLHPFLKSSDIGPPAIPEDDDDETQGVQSKERWSYVKVNMEGVVIGRKVCIFDHANYSSLALELEEMFGRHCGSGLRLLEAESAFSLFYKDRNENWRMVGDVPWKEFVDCVKRLKIAPKYQPLLSSGPSIFY
ncbi:auxin-responsive protein IAA32-like [Magnolia sinica]|uniref:auxin-responsive protein IAA32-like n=1 Tax=Magnolia sinica TaxID=86752 RepID=UPI0026592177|nr:auxin-responsive protein IAA32-like [Magnolia sinica]